MIFQLGIATAMVIVTMTIHGFGFALLTRALQAGASGERALHLPALSRRVLRCTLLMVAALFALHGLAIWLYAFVYHLGHAVDGLETAVYFSTLRYAAIGYDDHNIDENWRMLAGVEGINGVLLLGWSTAFFVTTVARMGR